jgi:hypothetical protein
MVVDWAGDLEVRMLMLHATWLYDGDVVTDLHDVCTDWVLIVPYR